MCLERDTAENVWPEIDLVALLDAIHLQAYAMDLCHATVLLANARQKWRCVAVMFIH